MNSSEPPITLFSVRHDYTNPETKNSENFQKVVAKILFATKKARPDNST